MKRLMMVAALAGGLLWWLSQPMTPWEINMLAGSGCRHGVCSWLSTEIELKRCVAESNCP